MVKRVVFVCQVFHPDTTSTSQLFTVLLPKLVEQGVDITVLCGFPSGHSGQDTALPRRENYAGIAIHRLGLRINHKRSLWHRALAYCGYLAHSFLVLLTISKPDLTFAVTNPPFLAQVLYLVSKLRRLRYQYMLLDMYPESLVAKGLRTIPLAIRLWRWTNRRSYHRADKIVVLGRDMVPRLAAYQLPPEQIAYVPHWSAIEAPAPAPVETSTMVRRLGLEGKFIVQYSGNMGLLHDMITFVRAAAALRQDPSIHFLFIGGGIRRPEAEALSAELGLENVTWHDFVPLEQLADSLASCHVSLVSLRQGLSGIAVPCKLYGILASGRAVLAQVPADSEIALTVEEHACGLVVAPGDVDGLVTSIRALAADREQTCRMHRRAFAAYHDLYSQEAAVRAFTRLWQLPALEDSSLADRHIAPHPASFAARDAELDQARFS